MAYFDHWLFLFLLVICRYCGSYLVYQRSDTVSFSLFVANDQPTFLTLTAPSVWQCWVLLPPQNIKELAFTSSVLMKRVEIFSTPPQSWESSELLWDSHKLIQLEGFKEINGNDNIYQKSISIMRNFVFLFFFALLILVLSRIWTSWMGKVQWIPTQIGTWANRYNSHVLLVMLIVWFCSLLWHLTYAVLIPYGTTDDSPGYLAFGHLLLQAPQFARSTSDRSPGYPLFLSLIIATMGDNPQAIVICQHLLLTFLAPLTVWTFMNRLPLLGAGFIGLAVGILPGVSVIANVIHTEALYIFCTTVALLFSIRSNERPYGSLIIGLFTGMATMVRPTGMLLLVIFIGWYMLCSWCAPVGAVTQKKALISGTLLMVGYVLIAAPWHLHLALVRHSLDISNGRARVTQFDAAVSQRRVDARLQALRPDRAVWELWMDPHYQPFTDPFRLQGTYSSLMTGVGQLELATPDSPLGNQLSIQETIRETDSLHPERLYKNQVDAFWYNLFLRQNWTQSPTVSAELSSWFVPHWVVSGSFVRSFCLRLSMFVLNRWWILAIAALCSLIGIVFYPSLQNLAPIWFYWLALVLSTSAIGMPYQRYIVVVEPLLVVLGSIGILQPLFERPIIRGGTNV